MQGAIIGARTSLERNIERGHEDGNKMFKGFIWTYVFRFVRKPVDKFFFRVNVSRDVKSTRAVSRTVYVNVRTSNLRPILHD